MCLKALSRRPLEFATRRPRPVAGASTPIVMNNSKNPISLSDRATVLFRTLVERYIEGGEPVGSRTLARETRLDLSAATIRNVMSDLEDLGLIKSPHTSAGRIPTVRGYRFFVDAMMQARRLSPQDQSLISDGVRATADVPALIARTSAMLSELSGLASIVMVPRAEQHSLRHVDFLPLGENRVLVILVLNGVEVQNRIIHTDRPYSRGELEQAANYINQVCAGSDLGLLRERVLHDLRNAREAVDRSMQAVVELADKGMAPPPVTRDYLVAGQTNLMAVNELADLDKLRALFDAFNRKRDFLRLLDLALDAQGVQIFIGEESGYQVLDDCSVVTATYTAEGKVLGVLGVIGPTRMPYDRLVSVVDVTARALGAALKSMH
jgi:heat-inducible transcriptional repressor